MTGADGLAPRAPLGAGRLPGGRAGRLQLAGAGPASLSAVAAHDTPMVPLKGQTGLAWIVFLGEQFVDNARILAGRPAQ